MIEPSTAEMTWLGDYPGYEGGRTVRGLVGIAHRSDGVQIEGLITGLEGSVTGGWHIHSGYSCSETKDGTEPTGAVGGHYFGAYPTNADPWNIGNTFYESDLYGVARISKTMPSFSLYGEWPVYGRTVVVHESNSAVKPACGVIGMGARVVPGRVLSMVTGHSVCPAGPCQTYDGERDAQVQLGGLDADGERRADGARARQVGRLARALGVLVHRHCGRRRPLLRWSGDRPVAAA